MMDKTKFTINKTYVFPLTDNAKIGDMFYSGKYIFEIIEVDYINQLMTVQLIGGKTKL